MSSASLLRKVWNSCVPGAKDRYRVQKAVERRAIFESEVWQREDGFARRRYDHYEQYLKHQSSKLGTLVHRLRQTEEEDFADFRRRFETCTQLAEARSVLCLAARIGTEVKALHSLGYFAVGIDLNPGADNPCVLPGDFHRLIFPDHCVDAVYTNSLDHVFDLAKLVAEVKRVLRPTGLMVVDLVRGFEEEGGFVVGAYEAAHWKNARQLVDKIGQLGAFTLEAYRDLGQVRSVRWMQAVLRAG